MLVEFQIQRFNPDHEVKPRWVTYRVPLEPTDRILDGLHAIKWQQDGTLAFRRSCGHGICGSDAMLINGKNRLACKVLIRDVRPPIVVAPMRGFPIVKDLVVDMEGFFSHYRSVKPYLLTDRAAPTTERPQSPAERERYDDTTKCILCGICTTACPSFLANRAYVGPAAIVQAHRFIFDSRDQGAHERLQVLNDRSGVWRCRTISNCTDACPRGIDVTKAIADVKKTLVRGAR